MKRPALFLPCRWWFATVALGFGGISVGASDSAAEAPAAPTAAVGTVDEPPVSLFRDSEDGYFDMTNFILSKRGFLAVPIVITEPAIGYGGGAALLFMKYPPAAAPGAPPPKRYVPPTITAVAGGLTENGTWFGGLV